MPDDETFDRTVATIILFLVWALIVLVPMLFPEAQPPPWEIQLGTTAVVFLVIGRMWDLEVERVLDGITISTDGGQPRERDDDREDE